MGSGSLIKLATERKENIAFEQYPKIFDIKMLKIIFKLITSKKEEHNMAPAPVVGATNGYLNVLRYLSVIFKKKSCKSKHVWLRQE